MDLPLWKKSPSRHPGDTEPAPEGLAEIARLFLHCGIVESTSLAVTVSTPDGRILYVNSAYERLFGPSAGARLRLPPDHPRPLRRTGERGLPPSSSGDAREEIVEAVDSAGTPFLLWKRVESIHDDKEAVLFVFTIMHRIDPPPEPLPATESNEAEPTLPEVAPDRLVCLFTPEGTLTFVNDPFCRFFGGSREERIGTNFFALVPRARSEDLKHRLHHSTRIPLDLVSVWPTEGTDGQAVWQQWTHKVIRDLSGEPVAFQGTAIDMTSNQQALQELWQAYLRLEQGLRLHTEVLNCLFEENAEVMLVVDYDTLDIVDANPSACRFYGYERERMQGMSLLTINTGSEEYLREKIRLVREGLQNRFVVFHRLSDGILRSVESYLSCADLGDRHLVFSIVHDLTERKRMEKALSRREEELCQKTVQLEEMNTALKVLLSKREEGKKELEESIVTNVRTLVLPHLDMLDASSLGEAQRAALRAAMDHLEEIVSPLLPRLSTRFAGLSPMELRIATLIKDGRRNKEIALILGVSENTVLTHRYHLRTKLGLRGRKVNLQTYLASVLNQ